MEQEIKEAIEKSLPKQVGEVLRQRLEKAELDATKVKHLLAENQQLKRAEQDFKELREGFKELAAGREALEAEKQEFEIRKVKHELQVQTEKTVFVQDVALGLVRNVEYRRAFSGTVPAGVKQDSAMNGCTQYGGPEIAHVDNTTTEVCE